MRLGILIACSAPAFWLCAPARAEIQALPDVRIANWVMTRHRAPVRVITSYFVENNDSEQIASARIRAVFFDVSGDMAGEPGPETRINSIKPGQSSRVSAVNTLVPIFSSYEIRLEGTFRGKPFKMRFYGSSPYAPPVYMPDAPYGDAPNLILMGAELSSTRKGAILDLRVKNMGLKDASGVKVLIKFFRNKRQDATAIERPLDGEGAVVPGGAEKRFQVSLSGLPAAYDWYNVALKYEGQAPEAALSGEPFRGAQEVELGEIYLKRPDPRKPGRLVIEGRARNGLDHPVADVQAIFSLECSAPEKAPAGKGRKPPPAPPIQATCALAVKTLKPGEFAPFTLALDNVPAVETFRYSLKFAEPERPSAGKAPAHDYVIENVPPLREGDIELKDIRVKRSPEGDVQVDAVVVNHGSAEAERLFVGVECLRKDNGEAGEEKAVRLLDTRVDQLAGGASRKIDLSAKDVPEFNFIRTLLRSEKPETPKKSEETKQTR